jgi:hypothetical protein
MSIQMQLWSIKGERPVRLSSAKLDLENRLETWICQDLSLVGEDLLLLGHQVATDFGHRIDVLALDREGNLVILELKRGRTPRDVVAQILDYASWAHTRKEEDIEALAAEGRKRPLEELFREHFRSELPDTLNGDQRLIIVATELDPQSERIVQFLSARYGVNINVVFFDFYRDGDREYIGRSWLVAPSEVERNVRVSSGKRALLSFDELASLADEHGVGDLYNALYEGLRPLCDQIGTTQSNVSFRWRSPDSGSRLALVSVYPKASDSEHGLIADIRVEELARQLHLAVEDLRSALPPRLPGNSAPIYLYAEGYAFWSRKEVDSFLAKLESAGQSAGES